MDAQQNALSFLVSERKKNEKNSNQMRIVSTLTTVILISDLLFNRTYVRDGSLNDGYVFSLGLYVCRQWQVYIRFGLIVELLLKMQYSRQYYDWCYQPHDT